jgi:hypothetical protein
VHERLPHLRLVRHHPAQQRRLGEHPRRRQPRAEARRQQVARTGPEKSSRIGSGPLSTTSIPAIGASISMSVSRHPSTTTFIPHVVPGARRSPTCPVTRDPPRFTSNGAVSW